MGEHWIIYARQSKGNKISIQQQLTGLEQGANQRNASIVASFTDAVSASKFAKVERKDWPDVLALIESGSVAVLGLWEVSRGDRRATPWSALLDLCAKTSTKIFIAMHDRVFDPNDDADWETLVREGISAELESRKMSKRILRDVAAAALEGRPDGKNLYGYRRVRADDRTLLSIEIVEDQAAIVREAATRFASGESLRRIAEDFTTRGLQTLSGHSWHPTQVRRSITNRSYLGIRTHKGVEYPGQWPAIVDRSIFDMCAQRLADPGRKTRKDGAVKHLLSGIARCGVCEATVVRIPVRGVLYYKCPRSHVAVQQAHLDEHVAQYVRDRMIKIREVQVPVMTTGMLGEDAQQRVAQLEQRLDEIAAEVASGALSARVAGKAAAQVEADLKAAQTLAQAVVAMRTRRYVVADGASWWERSIEQRRELVRDLVTISVGKVTRRGWQYSQPMGERVTIVDNELPEFTP